MNSPFRPVVRSFLVFALAVASGSAATVPLPAPSEWIAPSGAPAAPGDAFDVTFTGTAPVAAAPVIGEWNRVVTPDESFVLTGARFTQRNGTEAGTDTTVWVWADAPGGGALHACRIWRVTENTLTATLPVGVPFGMFLVWVENAAGASTPVVLNRTDAQWPGPLGNTVAPGVAGTKTVFGKNLSFQRGTTTAHAWLVRSGSSTWEPLTVNSANPFAVEVALPADLAAGNHALYLHNGHGGRFGWSGPLTLKAAAPFTRDSFEISLAPGGGDDTFALRNALNTAGARANGGTVRLAAGTFRLATAANVPGTGHTSLLNIPAKVRLLGAGRDATILRLVPPTTTRISYGLYLNGSQVALEDVDVHYSGEGGTFYYSPVQLSGADQRIHRCRLSYARNPRSTVNDVPLTRFNGDRLRFTDNEVFIGVLAYGSDSWFTGNTLFGGPYGADYLGLATPEVSATEAPIHFYGSNLVIASNRIETPDWPNVNGNRQFLDLIPKAELQWRPWAKRFFVTGGGNERWYVADNFGQDLGYEGNKGEMMLFHGISHRFYAQVASNAGRTLTMHTDGTIDGVAGYVVETKAPARSLSDFVSPWNAAEVLNPAGFSVVIVAGTGVGQSRKITGHTATTLTVERDWRVPPAADSIFVIEEVNRDIVIYRNEMNGYPVGYRLFSSASCFVSFDGNSIGNHVEANTVRRAFTGYSVAGGPPTPSFWNQFRDNVAVDIYTDVIKVQPWIWNDTDDAIGACLLGNTFHGGTATTLTAQQATVAYPQTLVNVTGSPNGRYEAHGRTPSTGTVLENLTGSGARFGLQVSDRSASLVRNNRFTLAGSAASKVGAKLEGADAAVRLASNTYSGQTVTYFRDSGTTTADSVASQSSAINATDGSTATHWNPGSNNVQHWLQVDLRTPRTLAKAEVVWSGPANGADKWRYRLEVSPSGLAGTWTVVANRATNTTSAQSFTDNFSAANVRYVRLIYLVGSPWPELAEFRVFAPASTVNLAIPPLAALPAVLTPCLRFAGSGTQTVPVANLGPGAMTWNVAGVSAPWLTATGSGSVAAEAATGALTVTANTATLPAGVHWGTVTLSTAGGESFHLGVRATVTHSALQSWRFLHFGTSAATGDAADLADPNGNGLGNILDYALGNDPRFSPASTAPRAALTDDFLTVTYTQNLAATDVAMAVEVSGDLRTWNSGPAFTTQVSASTAGALRTIVERDHVPVSSGGPRFIRLQVRER